MSVVLRYLNSDILHNDIVVFYCFFDEILRLDVSTHECMPGCWAKTQLIGYQGGPGACTGGGNSRLEPTSRAADRGKTNFVVFLTSDDVLMNFIVDCRCSASTVLSVQKDQKLSRSDLPQQKPARCGSFDPS